MSVPLKVRTCYSMLSSTINTASLVDFCRKNNINCVGIVDTYNLYSSMEFSMHLTRAGIKPVFGLEVHISDNRSLLLYAKNRKGFNSLIDISAIESKEGCISLDRAVNTSDQVIAVFSPQELKIESIYDDTIAQLLKAYGDNIYLSLERYDTEKTKSELLSLQIADKYKIPVVAINDIRFLHQEDEDAHKVLECIKQQTTLHAIDYKYNMCYMRTEEEMTQLYSDIPSALDNSVYISQMCSMTIEQSQLQLPAFTEEPSKELIRMSYEGLEARGKHKDDVYITRLKKELGVINQVGFPGYMLIVADLIAYAKANNIGVGPGRGSAAGSLVSWVLGITEIDPIKWGLLFERFLNAERVSMPDIDIDLCKHNRDKVIEYVINKYGQDRVAHIITFGLLHSRGVLKDVGRVMGMRFTAINDLSNLIPYTPLYVPTLRESIEKGYINYQKLNREERNLCELGIKLEGSVRHASIHAAGIVISGCSIKDRIPICFHGNSVLTQYSMDYVEKSGMLKFDLLGLGSVTIIKDAIKRIKDANLEYSFTEEFNDHKTYDLIAKGHTTGVFQLESDNMKKALIEIQPRSFAEIMAVISLYRPGPMENIPQYIKGKNNPENKNHYKSISSDMNKAIEDIIQETYGVIIYQEQVMEIAKVVGGFTLLKADSLRKAMGKKIKHEMASLQNGFLEGAQANGFSSSDAKNMFDIIEKFAGYGFNKSHAASYAYLSYQTAHLKANYTNYFLSSSLSLSNDADDKIKLIYQESEALGVTIMPPDINVSNLEFTVFEGKIYYGLGKIARVSTTAIEAILKARKARKFSDLNDFIARACDANLDSGSIDYLCYSGAFDVLHSNRVYVRGALKNAINTLKRGGSLLISDFHEFNHVDLNHYQLAELEYAAISVNLRFDLSSSNKHLRSGGEIYGIVTDTISKKFKDGVWRLVLLHSGTRTYRIHMYQDINVKKGCFYKIVYSYNRAMNMVCQTCTLANNNTYITQIEIRSFNITKTMMQIKKFVTHGLGNPISILIKNPRNGDLLSEYTTNSSYDISKFNVMGAIVIHKQINS